MQDGFSHIHVAYQPVATPPAPASGERAGDGAAAQQIACITITNPPVNVLNAQVIAELNAVLDYLTQRDDVIALIFTGHGAKSFIAGADIHQMLNELHTEADALAFVNATHTAFGKIERLHRPCIAAINGFALGGGLEFVLACHYRIADRHAKVGLPEVNLRLIPGFGGTQRLPRLLFARAGQDGLHTALRLLLTGDRMNAADAQEVGLLDRVATGEEDAVSLAIHLVTTRNEELWKNCTRHQHLAAASNIPQPDDATTTLQAVLQDETMAQLLQKSPEQAQEQGQEGHERARQRILQAVRYGVQHGITAGLQREAQLFAEALITDPQGGKPGIRAFLQRRK
jgi:acrylyl-CoA reductase (NADPH)/3-hydroxypropionyl-CoA dehydratase/3-hydroxypropionyl-CoA synthetase